MANEDVKAALRGMRLPQWGLAKIVGLSESALSKYLREEWSDSAKSTAFEILKVVDAEETPSRELVQKFRCSLLKKQYDHKKWNIDRIIDEMREKRISEEWGF